MLKMKIESVGPKTGLLLVWALLSSCGVKDGPPSDYDVHWAEIEDAVPKDEPHSRYGNPDSYEVFGERYYVIGNNNGFTQKGIASWYGSKFHGQRTSSGETYDMYAMTAAHKTLKIPAYVEVTNTANGRKAIVKVNDRGPFHDGRIIDLSYAAATKLGVAATGTAPVTIRVVTPGSDQAISSPGVDVEQEVASNINPAYTFDGGKVYVQIAAYSTEENALKMLDELREKNFSSVRIHVENNKGAMLYRVRIGPVPTTHVAEKLLAQLKEVNHNNAKIITYN
jgi:rare lipoprotein A